MLITGARIRSIGRQFASIVPGQEIAVGLTDLRRFAGRLTEVGFPDDAQDGDTILPAALGPISRYNCDGKYLIHRDCPKETAHRQVDWHWTEWHGPYEVEQSEIVDVPYQRYPRTFVPPPSVEMTMTRGASGNRLIVTPILNFIPQDHERIVHVVNLFLELFRECMVLDANLDSVYQPPIRRLNWTILPQGRMPWAQLRGELNPVVSRQPAGNRPVIWWRFETVTAQGPEFVAVGQGGFAGYVVFAFPERRLYVLECTHLDNATYVFEDDWETLSQLTKAEILAGHLQKARLIHRKGWDRALGALFR